MIKSGTIVKGIGGFYYVKTSKGIIECRARGKFRNESKTPTVGDFVEIEIDNDNLGYVKNIKERKNFFVRPPISNIDTLIIVAALKNPEPDFVFIDKMILIAKKNNVDVILCINKTDLDGDNELERIKEIYKNSNIKLIAVSTYENEGIDTLKKCINQKVTAFAGFSGVGKSSILKMLTGLDLETGDISKKLSRGKHTTRHVELLEYEEGSYLADTPGFSMLDIPEILSNELYEYYDEFLPYVDGCKFSDCSHINENKCAVKDAVENSEISKSRYESYKLFYKTLKEKENTY